MSQGTYTHKELAGMLGLSETTVKSYRRKFPGCIPVVSFGKPIRFSEEAAAVALRIRDLFETGMGVPDVRARLAAEFAWIEAEAPAAQAVDEKRDDDSGPRLSQGVSNMAKSLVDMSQKQKAILNRISGLEERLGGLAAQPPGGPLAGPDEAANSGAEERRSLDLEREARLEERLARLDEQTQGLAESVRDLAGQLARFLGERDQAAKEWREKAPETMAEAAKLAEATRATAKVIPLRPESPPAAPPPPLESPPADPGRAFFSLPLMVRTEQGAYVSAGGRSRGRFCLNDLKAMLIYGFAPPEHFSLRWEAHGQGWWLFLEQESGGQSVHMLLMELPGKGGNAAVILKLLRNGDSVHPAEICAIIDSLAS